MVSVSFSLKPELFKKVVDLKETIEADRMKKIALSDVINSLVKLGFAYREQLRLEKEGKGQMNLEGEKL